MGSTTWTKSDSLKNSKANYNVKGELKPEDVYLLLYTAILANISKKVSIYETNFISSVRLQY